MPIGELWDLEKLAEVCAAEKRWTFMLTSAPNNVTGEDNSLAYENLPFLIISAGGIGSTSNAIAIL